MNLFKSSSRSATSLSKEYNVSLSIIGERIQQDDPSNTKLLLDLGQYLRHIFVETTVIPS